MKWQELLKEQIELNTKLDEEYNKAVYSLIAIAREAHNKLSGPLEFHLNSSPWAPISKLYSLTYIPDHPKHSYPKDSGYHVFNVSRDTQVACIIMQFGRPTPITDKKIIININKYLTSTN